LIFRIGTEEEDAGERQGTAKDPNRIGKVFHARVHGLQAIGTLTEGPVQAATLLPTIRTRSIDAPPSEIHGEPKVMMMMMLMIIMMTTVRKIPKTFQWNVWKCSFVEMTHIRSWWAYSCWFC